MKTVMRDKAQCTRSYNIVIIIIIIIIIIIFILFTEFVYPLTIESIVASRRIPLDKGNGEVRPIVGVGEVIRRKIGKCVTRVAKEDVINASGAMQVCPGQKSGGWCMQLAYNR